MWQAPLGSTVILQLFYKYIYFPKHELVIGDM